MKRLGFTASAGIAVVTVALTTPGEAWAIKDGYGTEVVSCGYPMAVGVNGSLCQGTYIGGGLVLTAAHCVDEPSENPADIHFGDSVGAGTEFEYEDVTCELHPTFDPPVGEDLGGVDLAVCDLSTNMLGISLPAVPVVYPTPPDGCEVNYLRHLVSSTWTGCAPGDHWCPEGIEGVHVSTGPIQDGSTLGSGPKRWTDSVIVLQEESTDSPFMLLTYAAGVTEDNLVQGDSGAPFYMQMADGSWRVISVHSHSQVWMYSQAIPPYGHWVQQLSSVSGYDITPCHTKGLFGNWVYDQGAPNCQNQLMMAADAPSATWVASCYSGSDFGGGAGDCAGWYPGIAASDYTSPYLPGNDYDGIVTYVEGLVRAGAISCEERTIEETIVLEGELIAGWPFLGVAPRGYVELYREAANDAAVIDTQYCP